MDKLFFCFDAFQSDALRAIRRNAFCAFSNFQKNRLLPSTNVVQYLQNSYEKSFYPDFVAGTNKKTDEFF